MAEAADYDEYMPAFMVAEYTRLEVHQFCHIHDRSNREYYSPNYEPDDSTGWHNHQDFTKCKYCEPTHSEIDTCADPTWGIDNEHFD